MKILIIEDDRLVAETFSLACKVRWPEAKIISAATGREGIIKVGDEAPDAVILDLGLPDISGFDVLQQIRSFSEVPIMVSTVRSGENDIIKAHEIGADAYVVKPFSQLEFLSRLKALLRRKVDDMEHEPIVRGSLRYSPSMSRLIYDKRSIVLTRTEGLLLYELMKNENLVLSNTFLAEKIWGDCYHNSDNNIRSYILRLRKKIEHDPNHPKLILTKVRQGYYFTPPPNVE